MKAVILVGGEGTRLRPLTYTIPKAMVPILNRPYLEHMADFLKYHGVTDIILALCYLPDQIKSYFGDGKDFGVKLTYVVEDSPLGTAGAVKNVEEHLDDTFIVFNGDIFTDLDLSRMMDFHKRNQAKASIALTPVENPTIYGVVETTAEGRVECFVEKPSWEAVTTNMINAGTYILDRETLHYVPQGRFYMFEHGLFPHLLELSAPIYGYPSNCYWIDIGEPDKYRRLHHDLLLGLVDKHPAMKYAKEKMATKQNSSIDPTAKLSGPVIIGEGCELKEKVRISGPAVLGPGCTINRDGIIDEAILWRNVTLGEGASVRHCIIGNNCSLGEQSYVAEASVIGDNVTLARGTKLEPGTKIPAGKSLESNNS